MKNETDVQNRLDSFKVKNENYTQAFEDLSYRLFCRKHNFPEGIKADFNQAGLETYPKKSYATDLNIGFSLNFSITVSARR